MPLLYNDDDDGNVFIQGTQWECDMDRKKELGREGGGRKKESERVTDKTGMHMCTRVEALVNDKHAIMTRRPFDAHSTSKENTSR